MSHDLLPESAKPPTEAVSLPAEPDRPRRRRVRRSGPRTADSITGRVVAVGDIHGEVEQLKAMLDRLAELEDFDDVWVVFLGDFVDRGPDPKGVLDLVLSFRRQHPKTTAIVGNHEFAMLAALRYAEWFLRKDEVSVVARQEPRDRRQLAEHWIRDYLSETTFASYGVDHGDLEGLLRAVPPAHRAWLESLPYCVEHPDFLFVHSGLLEREPYRKQLDSLISKAEFDVVPPQIGSPEAASGWLPEGCRKKIVSGHIPLKRAKIGRSRIQIDTGAGRGGTLSAILLPEKRLIQPGRPASWGRRLFRLSR